MVWLTTSSSLRSNQHKVPHEVRALVKLTKVGGHQSYWAAAVPLSLLSVALGLSLFGMITSIYIALSSHLLLSQRLVGCADPSVRAIHSNPLLRTCHDGKSQSRNHRGAMLRSHLFGRRDMYIMSFSHDKKTPPRTAFLDVFRRPKCAYPTQDPPSV